MVTQIIGLLRVAFSLGYLGIHFERYRYEHYDGYFQSCGSDCQDQKQPISILRENDVSDQTFTGYDLLMFALKMQNTLLLHASEQRL